MTGTGPSRPVGPEPAGQPVEDRRGHTHAERLTPPRGPTTLLLAATLLLTALNLRAAVTSVGAVLRDIQLALDMSDAVAGILTTLPVVCFGLVGLVAARIGRRLGTDRALIGALVLVTAGLLIRATVPSTSLFLVTSLMALTGMALGNVLVPVIVKAWFPHQVGRWTGLYSMGVVMGTAVPAAVTVPIAQALGGWRYGLGIWAVPAAVALVPWWVLSRRRAPVVAGGDVVDIPSQPARVRSHPKAWALMVFFAAQSLEAYVAMGWLPSILQDAGIGAARAGLLTSLALGLAIPIAVIVPVFAARSRNQQPWVVLMTTAAMFGYLGLLVAPGRFPVLWTLLLGIGLGAFPLALLLIGLRARTARATSELSSLVQGWGYLLAATGPVGIGVLHEITDGWEAPLSALLALLVVKLIGGLIAGAPGFIDDGED